MASWGMAAFTGRKMWEESRRTQEENERLLAGRPLFDLQMEEAKKDADLTAQAVKESRRVQSLINSKKSDLQAGGERGAKALAEVMSGIHGGDGTAWRAQDGIIYEIDKSGNARPYMDLRNASGIAMLATAQQFVPDAATATATYQAAEKENQKTLREREIEVMKLDNQLRVALASGASAAQVAGIKGQYDIAVQALKNQAAVDTKKLDIDSAYRVAQVGLQKEFASQWDDPQKLQKYVTDYVVASAVPGGVPQYDTSGNLTGIGIINPTTKDVVPIELTPELRSGVLSQRDQLMLEGGQAAAANGYMAPAITFLGNAGSGMTQRRDAEVAAANAAQAGAIQSYETVPQGYALDRVQAPSYGLPAITTMQPVPVVSGVINPTNNLPVMSQIIQDVRQGIAQQNADNYRLHTGAWNMNPYNLPPVGYAGGISRK